jgi:hypothetical protein
VRAAALLEDLLALYPTAGKQSAALDEHQRANLKIAERELAKLRVQIDKRAAEQLPAIRERARTARELEVSSPEKAAAMYRALIDLYGDEPWAEPVIDEAKVRLETLSKE